MNARQIAEAIAALREAAGVLRGGGATIEQQMEIGMRCYEAAAVLKYALEDVQIEVKP